MVHNLPPLAGPVDASGEPWECADSELIHYAKAAVGREGRETPTLVVKWLAEFVVRAAAVPSSPAQEPEMTNDDFPRRQKLYEMTPAERAIYDAVQAVEVMAADVRLTDAVILLQAARDSVADFVDGIADVRRQVVVRNPALPPSSPVADSPTKDDL